MPCKKEVMNEQKKERDEGRRGGKQKKQKEMMNKGSK